MLVVEIDVIGPKPLQAAFAGLFHIVALAADAASVRIVGVAHDPELGGQDDLIALACDGAPHLCHTLLAGISMSILWMKRAGIGFRHFLSRRDSFPHHFPCLLQRIPGALMDRVPIWFERKFEFTFPVELHPNLCTRLRGTPARLEETVRGA